MYRVIIELFHKSPDDIDFKVVVQVLILKRNFEINVNGRFGPT